MGMSDEPWEILKHRQISPRRHLSPDEASKRFGALKGQNSEGLFDLYFYLSFDTPEGRWSPQLDDMKQLTGYILAPRKK